MKTIKLFYLAVLICGIFACQSSDKTSNRFADSSDLEDRADSAAGAVYDPKNETNESNVDGDGAAFMKTAALGGMMEVDLGKLAAENASDAKVKAFAAKMVTDHTKANNELKTIAQESGITLPEEYPADVKAHIDEMKKLKGAKFDAHYMDMMVNDHVKTLDLFRTAGLRKDALKDFAKRTLPVLEGHHKMAVEIKASLK